MVYCSKMPIELLPSFIFRLFVITECLFGMPSRDGQDQTHDARVLRQSSLYDIGENSNKIGPNKYLIGDSAYPLFEWLITPFRDNGRLNQGQRRFNSVI